MRAISLAISAHSSSRFGDGALERSRLSGRLGLEELLPLQELVGEPQMRLDDDVESAGSDEAISSGKERFIDRITSAITIVALRETPTRQCTSVAVPLLRPRSVR